MNKEIEKLVSNCEKCVTKPCQTGCPLNNDITGMNILIQNEKFEEAYKLLQKTTVLSSVCGRICPHFRQCQGKCVKGVSYDAVSIGKLETYIGDMAIKKNWPLEKNEEKKFNVAVIGAGPSGLTCAAFLRKFGIKVTLYEKHDYLGGLLIHGIPDFRLPKDIVKQTIDKILDLDIEVKTGIELGKDITIDQLKKEYDAIYIAIGANEPNMMKIPGEDLDGVYGGNDLLEKNNHPDYTGKTVIISGAGNVAMDVSRTAKRKGAEKVYVVYRGKPETMSAEKLEVEEAKADGIEFMFLSGINKIEGQGSVSGIEIIKNESKLDENNKEVLIPVEGSNYILPCDYVIMAIGSHPKEYVESFKLKTERGRIKIDMFGRTDDEKVFSGGDVAGSPGTVAFAARAGRNAAYTIKNYLETKKD